MTLPYEEKMALVRIYDFLVEISGGEPANGSRKLNAEQRRLEARRLLRHYPTNQRLDELYKGDV